MKVFLRILLMCALVLISCNGEKSKEQEILPLEDNEEKTSNEAEFEEKKSFSLKENAKISYELDRGHSRETIELIIYIVSEEQEYEIERYKINTFMGHVEQIGNKIYFNKRDIYDDSQGGNLFLFDGATGNLVDLGIEIVESFTISDDGKYLCYVIPIETKYYELFNMSLFIPGIEIKNLSTEEKYTYDFQDGFLKELYGTSVSITYDKELKRFDFGFSMDAPNNIGQGYINLSDMQYVQVKP